MQHGSSMHAGVELAGPYAYAPHKCRPTKQVRTRSMPRSRVGMPYNALLPKTTIHYPKLRLARATAGTLCCVAERVMVADRFRCTHLELFTGVPSSSACIARITKDVLPRSVIAWGGLRAHRYCCCPCRVLLTGLGNARLAAIALLALTLLLLLLLLLIVGLL